MELKTMKLNNKIWIQPEKRREEKAMRWKET